jgi:hypothetical protein
MLQEKFRSVLGVYRPSNKISNSNLNEAIYTFDPAMNKVKKAQLPFSGIAGLLYKFDIIII